ASGYIYENFEVVKMQKLDKRTALQRAHLYHKALDMFNPPGGTFWTRNHTISFLIILKTLIDRIPVQSPGHLHSYMRYQARTTRSMTYFGRCHGLLSRLNTF